jgi:O-antigen/teichoic acid export membrane protein
MLLLVVFSSLWMTSITVLTSTNRHQKVTLLYLAVTAGSLAVAWVLAHQYGLRGVAAALIGGEIVIASFVLRFSLRFLGDTMKGFWESMWSVPRWRSSER